MADRYTSFADLAAQKAAGIHYRISYTPRRSEVLVMAPHGGKIEPGTSEIARAIAGESYSVYCFEGIQSSRNYCDLHIASESFDEPQALEAVRRARVVASIHGLEDVDLAFVMVGGLDRELRDAIEGWLSGAGFAVEPPGPRVHGRSPTNICNRGRTAQGCQLEISRLLRDRLVESSDEMDRFTRATREAITSVRQIGIEDEG